MPRYVALLRAIANVPMEPFRRKLEALGFEDVESYGMSGNLFFTARSRNAGALERRVASAVGAVALVRTPAQLARAARQDPHARNPRAIVMFFARAPSRRKFRALAFRPPAPTLRGSVLHAVYPARLRDRRTPADFEKLLGVTGTFRSSRVVQALARRAEQGAGRRECSKVR